MSEMLDLLGEPLAIDHLKDAQEYGVAQATAMIAAGSDWVFEPKHLKVESNKWWARSALQKAVRRGRVNEAIHAAQYLFAEDEKYLWKSLSIIAAEDVSFGNSVASAVVFSMHYAKARAQVNTKKLMAPLLSSLCSGFKTRSACELDIATNWEQTELIKNVAEVPLHKRMAMAMFDTYDPPWASLFEVMNSYASVMSMRGRYGFKGFSGKKDAKALAEFYWYLKETLPEDEYAMCVLAVESCVDPMHMAIPAVLLGVRKLPDLEWADDQFPEEAWFSNFSGASLDMHVSKGKLALKAFHTSLSKDYSAVFDIPKEKAVKALGSVVFVEEGGLESLRLRNGFLDEIKDRQDRVLMRTYGVPTEAQDTLRWIVRAEFGRLNGKREWALQLAH